MNDFKYIFCFSFLAVILPMKVIASDSIPDSFFTGVRIQKSIGFYWMNGIDMEYSSPKILNNKLSFGISFVSSRLGSAIASNALPVHEVNLSSIKYFRSGKCFKPLLRLNTGYTFVNFDSDIFRDIPNHSFILAIEAGAGYDFHIPVRIVTCAGFNLITGNGIAGLGTIFPLYFRCSIMYRFN